MPISARARIAVLVVGVVCLAFGALLGWFAARQGSDASGTAASAADAASSAKTAASQAAIASEGWAHVSNGAYTLAKSEKEAAEAARRQAREFAAKAEKAAARADAAVAKIAQDRQAFDAARAPASAAASVVKVQPSARPARPARRASPKPVARALDEGCRRAIIYERTAADASTSRHAAYNAVMSGFAMNAHCGGPQHNLNEAYLLAQRASAESALHIGDWKADLARSDALLARCIERPEYRGSAGEGCRSRLRRNQSIRQTAISRREPVRAP